MHAADAVALLTNRFSIRPNLQQVDRIFNRLWTKLLLVPVIPVEVKEARRSVFSIDIADQEFDVEVADDFYAAFS